MYKLIVAAGLAAAAATGAQATVSSSFAGGVFGVQAGETLVADFDTSFGGGVLNSQANYYTGLTPNVAAPPAGDTTQYLAVLNGGSAAYSFARAVSRISFDVGSVDDYNSILVTLLGGGTRALNGSQINQAAADGNQFSAGTNGRLTIFGTAGEKFTGVSFSSTGNSFELDNLATGGAVPEASTWAMFLAGFGLLGAATRKRRRNSASPSLA